MIPIRICTKFWRKLGHWLKLCDQFCNCVFCFCSAFHKCWTWVIKLITCAYTVRLMKSFLSLHEFCQFAFVITWSAFSWCCIGAVKLTKMFSHSLTQQIKSCYELRNHLMTLTVTLLLLHRLLCLSCTFSFTNMTESKLNILIVCLFTNSINIPIQ